MQIQSIIVVQPKPPWYWRMIGRKYWKGWRVELVVSYDGKLQELGKLKRVVPIHRKLVSPAASTPPTPQGIAVYTAALVNQFMEQSEGEKL